MVRYGHWFLADGAHVDASAGIGEYWVLATELGLRLWSSELRRFQRPEMRAGLENVGYKITFIDA